MNGSVEFVTGIQGGGKSLLCIERAYYHALKGGWVFTNIELHPEAWRERMAHDGVIFDPQRVQMLKGDTREFDKQIGRGTADCPVMGVIDEAHLSHHARDFKDTTRAQLDLVSLARKLDIFLIFCTQDFSNVDKQFRKMAANLWHCRNLRQLKLLGVIPFPIPLMIRVCHPMLTGKIGPGSGEPVFNRKWVHALYNSDALLGASAKSFEALPRLEATALARVQSSSTLTRGLLLSERLAAVVVSLLVVL